MWATGIEDRIGEVLRRAAHGGSGKKGYLTGNQRSAWGNIISFHLSSITLGFPDFDNHSSLLWSHAPGAKT